MIPGGSADEEDLVSIDSHTALEEARLLRSDQPDHRVDFPLNEPPKPQRPYCAHLALGLILLSLAGLVLFVQSQITNNPKDSSSERYVEPSEAQGAQPPVESQLAKPVPYSSPVTTVGDQAASNATTSSSSSNNSMGGDVGPSPAPSEPSTRQPHRDMEDHNGYDFTTTTPPTTDPTPPPPVFPSYLPTLQQFEQDLDKHYQTHDPNCERFVVYAYTHWYGFGSQYNNMLLDFPISIWENRTLVMTNNWLVDYRCNPTASEGSYFSCFKDRYIGPKSCNYQDVIRHQANVSSLPQWFCGQDPPWPCFMHHHQVLKAGNLQPVAGYCEFLQNYHQMPERLGWVGDHQYTYFDMKAYALSKLWVLQDHVQQEVDHIKSTLTLEPPTCGFHIRRGDKVTGNKPEASQRQIDAYFQLAKDSGVDCRTCFIASDNITGVLNEAHSRIGAYLPHCYIQALDNDTALFHHGYDWWGFRNSDGESQYRHTLSLLASLEVLSTTDLFVGSYSSNIGRLVAILRASKGLHPASSYSVDDKTWIAWRTRRRRRRLDRRLTPEEDRRYQGQWGDVYYAGTRGEQEGERLIHVLHGSR